MQRRSVNIMRSFSGQPNKKITRIFLTVFWKISDLIGQPGDSIPKSGPQMLFIGNYLRMELLSRAGRPAQLLKESREYFDYMALKTGTLWENTGDYASCNHGFASHILHCFYRDILGVAGIENNRIRLVFHDLPLTECQGTLPVSGGLLSIRWTRSGSTLTACNPGSGRLPDTGLLFRRTAAADPDTDAEPAFFQSGKA